MTDINRTTHTGRVGHIELNAGETRLMIRLAVSRRPTEHQPTPEPDWFTVLVFGKRAPALMSFVKVGHQIMVEGQLRTGTYVNRDGTKVAVVEIVADELVVGAEPQGRARG